MTWHSERAAMKYLADKQPKRYRLKYNRNSLGTYLLELNERILKYYHGITYKSWETIHTLRFSNVIKKPNIQRGFEIKVEPNREVEAPLNII